MPLSRLLLSAALILSAASVAHAAETKPVPPKAAPLKPAEAKANAQEAVKPAAKPAPKVAAKPAPAKPEILTAAALVERAYAAMSKGQIDTALLLGQAAIVAESANPAPYVALGDLYVRANQAEFARGFYDQALNLDPQYVDALAAVTRLETMPQAKPPANGG